ncbi:MAG: cytochrome c3 family protein [Syntrophaceae bacterium]|nr:cytochrome c3 family protein [Syntrophaceae bacterium]
MIPKYNLMILLIAALLSITTTDLMAQQDSLLLNHPEIFLNRQRPPVTFPHNRHVEGGPSCKDCHHQYKNGENSLDESTLQEGNPEIRCSACHHSRSGIHLREAFHYQCLSCHKKNEKERKKTGPRFCGGCHLWN